MATDNDGRLVLEIIYPGGKTVLYDRPVPAKEIMDQHPKYCIARPDVFRVPWFVVSPEATLMPGKQYLVVPKGTVKQLLKKHKSKRDTASLGKAPAMKESPNPALRRSATIYPDEKNVNSDKGPRGAKLGCMPLAKLKVSSKLFLRSFYKVNRIEELRFPYFRYSQTKKSHHAPPPQPPQIHLPEQAFPAADSQVSAKTRRREMQHTSYPKRPWHWRIHRGLGSSRYPSRNALDFLDSMKTFPSSSLLQ